MASKKTRQKQEKLNSKIYKLQKWLLNFAIVCLAIIIFSFMLSSTRRFSSNPEKIDLSRQTIVNEMPKYGNICIEVLNGCGIPGMAGKYTEYLRRRGFDVIYTGNADQMNYPETFVFANDTSDTKLTPLLNAMNFTKKRIEFNSAMDTHINYQIILGKDCDHIPVFETIKNMENTF
ncbi:MAG: LytR C-terminal domain-containing protein [Fidelibacterota bacterium]